MNGVTDDARQTAILEAAWQCFAAYGFRKTSMEDIAHGAGLSRPALYQYYRNKEDIFRRLAQVFFAEAAVELRRALNGPGTVPEVLAAGFAAQGGRILEAMLKSPHGIELIDTSRAAARDIAEAGEAQLAAIFAEWLEASRAAGRIGFAGTPQEVAATMAAALKGLKSAAPDYDVYLANQERLAHLIGGGLAAGAPANRPAGAPGRVA